MAVHLLTERFAISGIGDTPTRMRKETNVTLHHRTVSRLGRTPPQATARKKEARLSAMFLHSGGVEGGDGESSPERESAEWGHWGCYHALLKARPCGGWMAK